MKFGVKISDLEFRDYGEGLGLGSRFRFEVHRRFKGLKF